jgi:hypothetical protein
MTKFQISTPGGYEVEVSAASEAEALDMAKKNWQTMPKIIAKGEGNTRVFERQNGQQYVVSPGYSTTDPAKVKQVLEGLSAAQVSKKSIDQALIRENPVAARANQFVRGAPLFGSYAEEAVGAIAGPEAATAMRSLSGAMQREKPGETLALNLAGGITGTLPAILAAPGAIPSVLGQGPMYQQIARGLAAGSLSGGAEGLVYGAGEGTDAESRMQEAVRGGGFGTTFGGLLGGATPPIAKGIQNIAGLVMRSDIGLIAKTLNISTDAAKVIKNTFASGGDIQQATQNLQRAGSEAMLADAGQAAQALVDAAAASGGSAGQITNRAISERMTRTGENLDQSLTTMLGQPPLGPQTAVREIAGRTKDAREAAYKLAYGKPVPYGAPEGQAIDAVLSRISPDVKSAAIKEANEEMLSKGLANEQIMARIADNGDVTFTNPPNVIQLDYLKRALDAKSQASLGELNKQTPASRRYARLASELKDATVNAVPEFGSALKIGGDKIAEENAFKLGRDMLSNRTEVEDVMMELGQTPSSAQLEAARLGLRSSFDKMLGDVKALPSDPNLDARQVLEAVKNMSSENSRKKARALMGPDADAMFAQFDEAMQSATVRAALARNSATASRVAQKETIDQLTQPGVAGQAAQGEVVNTTKALIQAVTGQTSEYSAARRQKIYTDIARALTQKRGDDARIALQVLNKAMSGQALTDRQAGTLANMISGVLFGGGTTAMTAGASAEERNRPQ